MALPARDKTTLLARSTVGRFFPLPWLGYDVGTVALATCHFALAAARAPPGAMCEDAQSDSKFATTRDEPAGVESAEPWPKCDEPARLFHVGWSDSPAQ